MLSITFKNFKGDEYSGLWNGKTYKSNIADHPEYLRIYVSDKAYHITPEEFQKIGGDINAEKKKRYIQETERKLEQLVKLLEDSQVEYILRKNKLGHEAIDIINCAKNAQVTAPKNL